MKGFVEQAKALWRVFIFICPILAFQERGT
jgi:hypothetical protein